MCSAQFNKLCLLRHESIPVFMHFYFCIIMSPLCIQRLPCSRPTDGRGQTRDFKWRLPPVLRSLRDNDICAVRKTRRGRRARKTTRNNQLYHSRSCKSTSLVSNTPHLNITLLNAHSVRNDKTTMVTEHQDDCNTDIALLTGTWLKDEDRRRPIRTIVSDRHSQYSYPRNHRHVVLQIRSVIQGYCAF